MSVLLRTLKNLDVTGKRVLCRVDLNVPMKNGRVIDTTRITRLIPTLNTLRERGAKVVVISHFGRPKGAFAREMSLAPLADELGRAMGGVPVKFALDCLGEATERAVAELTNGEVLLLENLRFHPEEEKNDPTFAQKLARLGDLYVNDAFACSHRAHASLAAISAYLPAVAGLLMEEEISALEHILTHPKPPVMAVVGGSKVSTKLDLFKNLLDKMSCIAIGGAMANTFLAAQGIAIGKSLFEPEMIETAKEILSIASAHGCKMLLPTDVVIARELKEMPACRVVDIHDIPSDHMILDIGPNSVAQLLATLSAIHTLVWNGPLGAFEYRPFDSSSVTLARGIAYHTRRGSLKSIAGGGDVIAAVAVAGVAEEFSYISTAGGAFLEWLEGKKLPGVAGLYGEERD